MGQDDIFNTMIKKATEQVSKKGLNATTKAITLAAFGMLARKIDQKIDRITWPARIVAISAAGSALWYLISSIFNLG